MLYYYCTDQKSLKKIGKKGIKEEVELIAVEAIDHCVGQFMLVVDPLTMSTSDTWYGKDTLHISSIPPHAIRNINPYRKPCMVIAGGGFVTRKRNGEKEIVLIRRKGKWDIPKGKLDDGEAYEECAVREVQEEIGIQDVQIVQPLGSTYHCYERKGLFCIKRTYWYEMSTTDTDFSPQQEEDIEEVAWFTWAEAKHILDYPCFVLHMEHVEHLIMK